MERRLLLISDENGFLLKSIRMNFIRQGFVVTDARASSKDIELKQSQNAVFFLFLDAEVNANAMAWRYIRSLCERNEKSSLPTARRRSLIISRVISRRRIFPLSISVRRICGR